MGRDEGDDDSVRFNAFLIGSRQILKGRHHLNTSPTRDELVTLTEASPPRRS